MEGNNSGFYSRMRQQDASFEISERAYNLMIGALLTWGFLITFGLCKLMGPALAQMMYSVSDFRAPLIIVLIGYFVLTLTGSRMLHSESTATCLAGYHLIVVPVGLLVSVCVMGYDPGIVTRAAMLTAIISVGMMAISAAFPHLFEGMGRALGMALLLALIVGGVSMIIFPHDYMLIDLAVIVIMALYIGFDWSRALRCQCTAKNAIAVSASLYLDIMNIFLRILRILGRSSRK